ncbi:hypothetical protein [Clostridium sp.]|uniref:hypothetical protein n=1 Tax=Clostridium sp. TaxID=1506 RepID=UPI003463D71D
MFACKDYGVNYLEYWSWNIPIFDDMEINPRINGLEVYSIKAFRVQWGFPQLMIYFRPMSLSRSRSRSEEEKNDIAPKLTKEDIEVHINGERSEVYVVNRILEYVGENSYMTGYLIHVSLNKEVNKFTYNKIDVAIVDRETDERGEGSVFWKEDEGVTLSLV